MTVEVAHYFSYDDAPAAIRWYEAMGFAVVARQDDGERVIHAELTRGGVVVMLSSFDDDYHAPVLAGRSTGYGMYLVTDDVDELYERALAAGSRPVIVPEQTLWSGRRARVLDPGGYEWSFGTYRPGA